MNPIKFPGHNVVFAEDQPQYKPLPALIMPDGEVITCWELEAEELAEINRTGKIYLSQLTFNTPLQPIMPMASLEGGIELKEE